jgi:hypothetical protein
MGQLLTQDSLIEVFREPASPFEIRSCEGKLIDIEGKLLRKANREDENVAEDALPHLWFIMPTASDDIRRGFGFRKTRTAGVYRSPKYYRAGLIVVHQLAITEETMWIRLLGKDGNQNRAIQEFLKQSTSSGLCANIEEVLADYRTNLELSSPLTLDDEELIMQLSAAYLKKKEEWTEEVQVKIALNLLQEKSPIDFISRTTGLSIEIIEKLCDRA